MLTYELRLGVTGHRALRDERHIALAIERLLERIDHTLNHRAVAPLAWTAVSALARGADRLFADVVLKNKLGRLEVVTPFPMAEYVNDFDAGPDRDEFDRLFKQAKQVDQLSGNRAAEAYLRAGERVVDTCELVVAIWDGRPSSGGGTGDVVEYATKRERRIVWIDSDNPDAEPRVIRSVEYGKNGRLAPACSVAFPRTVKALSLGYHQQAHYLVDEAVSPEVCAAAFAARRDALLDAARTAAFDADTLMPLLGEAARQFARADLLAQHYQRRHQFVVNGVLYLAAAAVTVAVGQVLFFPDRPWLIVFEIAAMTMVLGLWWWGRGQAWHEKWLHDRYLAERLRAAVFSPLVGTQEAHQKRDDPLPFYHGPKHWLAQAVTALTRTAPPQLVPFQALKRFIVSQWLEDQRNHHATGAAKKAHAVHQRHLLGFGLFGVTLFMAVLHFAGVGHPHGEAHASLLRADLWIAFLALVLPAWAGAIHAATVQLELERLAERSQQMARALDRAVHQATSARSMDELRVVCRDAEELMANENHEWWVLLSFQRLRLHV